jgi:hypothetical protein
MRRARRLDSESSTKPAKSDNTTLF